MNRVRYTYVYIVLYQPKTPALGTAGSVMTIGTRLTSPDCGKVIQAEPLFLLLDREEKCDVMLPW